MDAEEGAALSLETMDSKRSVESQPQAARRAKRSGGNRPGTRRRHLIRLGIDPGGVHRASRSRKGYWRMSQIDSVASSGSFTPRGAACRLSVSRLAAAARLSGALRSE